MGRKKEEFKTLKRYVVFSNKTDYYINCYDKLEDAKNVLIETCDSNYDYDYQKSCSSTLAPLPYNNLHIIDTFSQEIIKVDVNKQIITSTEDR